MISSFDGFILRLSGQSFRWNYLLFFIFITTKQSLKLESFGNKFLKLILEDVDL